MLTAKSAFCGISVNDLSAAKKFYSDTLGLKLREDKMGLHYKLPGDGGILFIYEKPDHQPATYTALNFVVDDIDKAHGELTAQGVTFEHYDFGGHASPDEKGILRGKAAQMGPDIAWFKDPAGNTLSILAD